MCDHQDTNPITGRNWKNYSPKAKLLREVCKDKQRRCSSFSKNTFINPVTKRKLIEKSDLRTLLAKICGVKIPVIKIAKLPEVKKKINSEVKKATKFSIKKTCINSTKAPLQCTLYDTVKLKKHQNKVCKFLASKNGKKSKGLVIFHSVGSGKTITALTIVRCIIQEKPDTKIFLISPKSLVWNFKKEIEKLHIDLGENTKFYSHGQFIRKIKASGAEFARDSVIVVDEVHHFKAKIGYKTGKNAQNLMKATNVASKVFLLTATPIQNNTTEFANLYAMVSGKERKINSLYNIFEKAKKSVLLELLKDKISYYKNDDVSDYPSVSYENVESKMTSTYYKLYRAVEENTAEAQEKMGTKNLHVFINGVRRAVNSIDNEVPTPKVDWTFKKIKDEVKKHHKVLVYSNWLKSGIHLIEERLDLIGIKYVQVTGSMSADERKRAVMKYNSSNKVYVLMVSSAGGEGLDLKETRSVVILEPHWNNEKIRQVIGRAVRYQSHKNLPKKDRHVDVYNLILDKPSNTSTEDIPSADRYLLNLSDKKDQKINTFYDILLEASI